MPRTLLAALACGLLALPTLCAAQGSGSKDPDAEARQFLARCRQGDKSACAKLEGDVAKARETNKVVMKMICDNARRQGKPLPKDCPEQP